MIPNQDTYHPGDVAQLLVVAPFAKGNGLLTVSANDTTQTQRFTLEQRLGRRQGADRRHRHARGHRAGRPRRTSAAAA